MESDKTRVCPAELAGSLDNRLRKLFHNPRKILTPFIHEGITALDIGCGPGFFSLEMAMLVGASGKVIAADLQQEMLDLFSAKIINTELNQRVKLVNCSRDSINVKDKIDFAFAFYVIHEIPDKERLFNEVKQVLNADGKFLIIEPKHVHVSVKEFKKTIQIAESIGFTAQPGPKVFGSQSRILTY